MSHSRKSPFEASIEDAVQMLAQMPTSLKVDPALAAAARLIECAAFEGARHLPAARVALLIQTAVMLEDISRGQGGRRVVS